MGVFVQEKSTYFDVQLLRQPTKNEKRKLVQGTSSSETDSSETSSSPSSALSSQSTLASAVGSSMDRYPLDAKARAVDDSNSSLSASLNRSLDISPKAAKAEQSPGVQQGSSPAVDINNLNAQGPGSFGEDASRAKSWSPAALGVLQSEIQSQLYGSQQLKAETTNSFPAANASLSQSFDQRSTSATSPTATSPNAVKTGPSSGGPVKSSLSSSVDAAISANRASSSKPTSTARYRLFTSRASNWRPS